ncbi:MAG: hypothetical protein HYT79_07395 [Elusimicrobia bacterium]|nr:hypothetical protein [Elusimicrobiota bacterium]
MAKKHRVEHVLPASNPRFIEKAAQSDADVLFLDLEDAVATSVKVATRQTLIDAVKATDFKGKKVFVRPNNLRTKWAAGDYYFVMREIGNLVTGVTLPKVVGAEDIDVVDRILTAIEEEKGWPLGQLKIETLIELPSAVLQVEEIARIIRDSGRAGALIFGLVDYTAATGGRPQAQEEQWTYPVYPKKRIVDAAKKFGLDAIDGITIHVKNFEQTKKDALLASQFGFTGKWSLHPEQIRAVLEADKERPFTPSRADTAPGRNRPGVKPFPYKELERLAKESLPVFSPLTPRLKVTKARRSVWTGPAVAAPAGVDDVAQTVVAVKNPDDVRQAAAKLKPGQGMFLKIDAPETLAQAYELATASERVEGLIYALPSQGDAFESKGALVAAASAADVDAIDGPALAARAQEEAQRAAIMGFSGKVAALEGEVVIYNKIFSPTPEAIARALEVVELYHKADVERGLGAIVYVDPRKPNAQEELVDAATVKVERRILAVAHKAKLFTPEQEAQYQKILDREKSQDPRKGSGPAPGSGSSSSGQPQPASNIKRVSILGAGEIGAPLAARMARHGVKVALGTLHLDTLAKAEKKIKSSLEFRAKEAVGILPLEKKLAKASPDEKSVIEAKIKELSPQMKELRDRWQANITTYQDTNYLNLVNALSAQAPQMVVECIREELLTKQSILGEWAKALRRLKTSDASFKWPVFATTTSSLLVTEIGRSLPKEARERFLDFHPFNPPDRMDLVEIVYAEETDPSVVEETMAFAKTLALEPVLVKDSCGFIVNRILFVYLNEAVRMLERGEASLEQIIRSAYDFGYPMGPLRLVDFVGVDVAEAIISNLHNALPAYAETPSLLFKALLGLGRYGNKSQKGFFSYAPVVPVVADVIRKRSAELGADERLLEAAAKLGLPLDSSTMDLLKTMGVDPEGCGRLAELLGRSRAALDEEALRLLARYGVSLTQGASDFDPLRLPLVMLNEAARIVEDGLASVADIDLAMDLGTRFPEDKGAGIRLADGVYTIAHEKSREPLKNLYAKTKYPKLFASGPFGWALRFGLEEAVLRLESLAERFGPLYAPSQFLRDLELGCIPKPDKNNRFRTVAYKRAFVKPKGAAGPATEIFEEGIVPTISNIGAYQIRASVLIADINANWKWGTRDYPIDLSKYHHESGTVGGSAGLVLVTEVGKELAQVGTIKPGDIGIMLSGKHDVITTEALGGSAQAHRSFRIHAYEAKDPLEGSYSQEVVLDWSQFVKVDEGAYTFEELGGVGLVYPTVQHAWNVLNVKKGDVVLVEGAVGGTGAAAVETAKSRNTTIVGLVSSEERGRRAMELYGADSFIDRIKHDNDEDYVNRVKEVVRELTGSKRLLDKVLAYSGQGMFARHLLSVREGDPMDAQDYGGQVAYFGAGETGFALEIPGTASDTPLEAMFDRIAKLRRERYRVPQMRHCLIVAGEDDQELKQAVQIAKNRRADIIVAVQDDRRERMVHDWKILDEKGWWHKAKSRDGVVNLSRLGIKVERMPEPPAILPDHPTEEQKKNYEAKQQAYHNYMRQSLIPFGKSLGEIWGKDSTGRPLYPDVAVVLADGALAENVLNHIMFTGFFTQIGYPNDTSRLKLRWHAALGWMNQNSIVLSRKAILGTHYASPAESTAIIDWIMRGVIRPVATEGYWPRQIGQAQEGIGTGKNAILMGVSKRHLKTLEDAYQSQDIARFIEPLGHAEEPIRKLAARKIHKAVSLLAVEAKSVLGSAGLGDLILWPPTAGLAVEPKRFEAIRAAWGSPELAQVPAEHQAREFTVHVPGAPIDILMPAGEGAISKYLSRFGHGLQQIEFVTPDVQRATELLKKFGLSPIYEAPRPGANGTKVNFVLVPLAEDRKVLVELVELVPGARVSLAPMTMTALDIRVFAKASGDRNPFHLDEVYAQRSRYGACIAHGILTVTKSLAHLEEFAPGYDIRSIEVLKFTAAVKVGDRFSPGFEIKEKTSEGFLLGVTAKNQHSEDLFEAQVDMVPAYFHPGAAPSGRPVAASWAFRWSRDVAPFVTRPAPSLKSGDNAAFRPGTPDTGCFVLSEDTMRAFEFIVGSGNPHCSRLACLGPIGCTSALFAPGYILAGVRAGKFARMLKTGEAIQTRVKVLSVETTKSGKTLAKVSIDVLDEHGSVLTEGQVTKILAELKNTNGVSKETKDEKVRSK